MDVSEVAWCYHNATLSPSPLSQLPADGNSIGIYIFRLLLLCLFVAAARICFRIYMHYHDFASAHLQKKIIDLSLALLFCISVSVCLVMTLYRVIVYDDCQFKDAGSAFMGFLIASCGLTLAVSVFELMVLISDNGASGAYKEVCKNDEPLASQTISNSDAGAGAQDSRETDGVVMRLEIDNECDETDKLKQTSDSDGDEDDENGENDESCTR